MGSLAFYSCYLGPDNNWSNVVYSPPSLEHPCYYFTNNPTTLERAVSLGWIGMMLDIPIENSEIHNCQNTKLLRCCPQLFEPLNTYEYLCYLDSKVYITDLDLILSTKEQLTDEMPLALTRHPVEYSSVWGEFDEAMKQHRYAMHRSRYETYIKAQLRMGFEDIPLRHCCGFSIRKQNDLMKRIGEMWYIHIGLCGIEDQISWQFVIQKFPGAVCELPYKACWGTA